MREIEALGDPDPFDVQSLIAGDGNPMEWLSAASTVPFLSDRRVVIVRHLLRATSPSEAFSDAKAALSSLPESARLILVADDESTTDIDRLRRMEGWKTSWENVVKQAGGLVLEFKVDAKALKSEILRQAERLGKTIKEPTAELLLEMTGRNLSRAIEELEKVALFVGDEGQIESKDVATAVMPSREWNVFRLVDSIIEGNVSQSLGQLRTLVGSGTKAESAAMQNIFPNLIRNLKQIWQARVCLDHGADPANLPEAVVALLPEQGSIASTPDWQRRKAMASARKITIPQLAECLAALARADARLKGLQPSYSAGDALELMVLEMVDAVRKPADARIKKRS